MVLLNDNADTRRIVEHCYRKHATVVNPIIEWTDADVWEFIRTENIPYCELYNEGYSRLGCIGCPMAARHGREREFLRWPKYKAMYLRSFDKMLTKRQERGLIDNTWRMGTTAQDVYRWWMEYDTLPGQIDLLEEHRE